MTMYQPLHKTTAVQQLHTWLGGFGFNGTDPDGLEVTPPINGVSDYHHIPDRLREWLLGLRLLRGVPLTHLVPDPALLPPESIRFFHVDPTWTDRLVDGALSTAGAGTNDFTFAIDGLMLIRNGLDSDLEQIVEDQAVDVAWQAGKDPMTGMLIRSELVRRWPDLVVRAKKKKGDSMGTMAILRKEPISRDVMIALFAGSPSQVEVREPDVAMRFGVERVKVNGKPTDKLRINLRGFDGTFAADRAGDPVDVDVEWRKKTRRVLNISELAVDIKTNGDWKPGKIGRDPGARDIAINLEQLPYVQVFTTDEPESEGSKPTRSFASIQGKPAIALQNGRYVHIERIAARRTSPAPAERGD